MNAPFFLTEVAEDWHEHNLKIAQETLFEAEQATLRRTDKTKDPLLDTPNFNNFRGYTRWVMVQKHFEKAATQFQNITHKWVNLGGVNVLELHGKNTIVTPCHLLNERDTPNETVYRRDFRIQNQVCPFLFPFENDETAESKDKRLRVLLIHGGKDSTFAYLRAYIDAEDKSVYRNLSQNIMLMPALLPSIDFEPVEEPNVGLNDAGEQKKSGESQ